MQKKCVLNYVAVALVLSLFGLEVAAMTAKQVRVVVWKKGETIAGEEFIAATESIVDYLATLRRPDGNLSYVRYDCMVKSRAIQPSLNFIGNTNNISGWTEVRMVYELRDCAEVP